MDDFWLYLEVFPWLGYCISGFFGLIFGSFLTFLFYRIQNNEPWLWGQGASRSKCPSCKINLGAIDLIPVLSWAISCGKCRHCKKGVPIRYPLIEIGTSIIFLLIYRVCQG